MTARAGTRDHVTEKKARPEPEPQSTNIDAAIADLRAMQESGEHLNETIEEAREAVQAAHEANSMRSPGAQGYGADAESGGAESVDTESGDDESTKDETETEP